MPSRVAPSIHRGGTNLERAGSHNYRVILNTIRSDGPISRTDLAATTGLTRQAVHAIVGRLEAAGLVRIASQEAVSLPRRGRGAPAMPVELNPDGAFSLGLLIDQLGVDCVLVDFAGVIVERLHVELASSAPEAVLAAAGEVRRSLTAAHGDRLDRVIGTGIAVPGPFRVAGITDVGPTGMTDLSLPGIQDALAERLGMPVTVFNDASAAALAEHLYGIGKGLQSFAYLYFGVGLGAGLVLGGELHRGRGGNAGEIAHMIVQQNGRPCECGNRGCLERYVSIQALSAELGLGEATDEMFRELDRMLLNGEPRLEAWLKSAGNRLRQAINILETLLDLDAVIMGGRVSRRLLSALERHARPLAHSIAARGDSRPRLLLGRTGADVPALGAAALPLFREFSPRLEALLG